MEKLLSVYIPTYNRPQDLYRTLGTLLSSYAMLSPEEKELVEIVVSDNASDICPLGGDLSNTLQNENLRYIRQKENVGIVKNAYLSMTYCSGKYLWILSDDDFLEESILSKLLPILRNRDDNFIFFNFDVWQNHKKVPSLYTGSTGQVDDVFHDLKQTENFLINCFQIALSSAFVCRFELMKRVFDSLPADSGDAYCWTQLAVFYAVKLGRGYIVKEYYLHKNERQMPSYYEKIIQVYANVYLGCMNHLSSFHYTKEDIEYVKKEYAQHQFALFFPALLSDDKVLRKASLEILHSFYEVDPSGCEKSLSDFVADGVDICISAERYRLTDEYRNCIEICNSVVDEAGQKRNHRNVVIWGAGRCGIAVRDALFQHGIRIEGFVDSRFACSEVQFFEGTPILHKHFLTPRQHLVVIAVLSAETSRSIQAELQGVGFGGNDVVFFPSQNL